MQFDDIETTVKAVVLGNGRVGKSSLAKLFCEGVFTDTYKKTIGGDFMEKQFELDELGETVHMMIWDTAGQEEFDSLTSRYYKGAPMCILVEWQHPREKLPQSRTAHLRGVGHGDYSCLARGPVEKARLCAIGHNAATPLAIGATAKSPCNRLHKQRIDHSCTFHTNMLAACSLLLISIAPLARRRSCPAGIFHH